MGIYKWTILRKKKKKQAIDQKKSKFQEKEKKHAFVKWKSKIEEKKKENILTIKK